MTEKILKYFDDDKFYIKIFIIIVIFLSIIKLPSIFTSDIQPWDEGMYATRVLSIHESGDFIDQSQHSVGNFYSGSHPPLLISIAYLTGLIFGYGSIMFKLLIFIIAIACLWLIILIGRNFFTQRTGIIASLIFSSNIIFNVFSERFQFDIPYTFLILLSFFFFLKFLKTQEIRYNIYAGIIFGLLLVIKILVGFFVPMVIFLFLISSRGNSNYKFSNLFLLSIIGIAIALPWHIFMIIKYGTDFLNYFFFYHIYERALFGVEHNTKGTGIFYHISYLMTILPYGVIILYGAIKQILKFKKLNQYDLFLIIWFLTGFFIITIFKTKLEVYILLMLTPGIFLVGNALKELETEKFSIKLILLISTAFNIFWMILNYFRIELNFNVNSNFTQLIISGILFLILSLILIFLILKKNYNLSKIFISLIFISFIFINILYALKAPIWTNTFIISPVRNEIEKSGFKKLVYVATNYRHNPQFSFYFNGLDLGWKNDKFEFTFLDAKNGNDKIKDTLNKINGNVNVIIEKDKINRTEYSPSDSLIDKNYHLVLKSKGYELYQK